MIDEAHLTNLKLWNAPLGQKAVGHLFLTPNYRWMPNRTTVHLEGVQHIPDDQTVMFAMNHTDRYNYWPFQYQMWRRGDLPYTTTWVKGKYYANKLLGWFFDQCNNIPLPSRGYLIFQDARLFDGRRLEDATYRALRDHVDGKIGTEAALARVAAPDRALLTEARRDFDPARESYGAYIRRWNDRLMGLVEWRTLEALRQNHNNVIVFPQGTRSVRLLPGKPGMAQFALRHRIPVVPVGCMGSENVYPGASPWASGGDIVYRIGEPLTHAADGAFGDCRIEEEFRPFTEDAAPYRDAIDRATERITLAINALLDEPYQLVTDDDPGDARAKADRFI